MSNAPAPELRRLDAFVGRWTTNGRVPGDGSVIAGTDTYEWLAGGYFLIHRVDVRMGADEVKAIEIISWDAERGAYTMHSFDSQGQATVMHASVSDRTWRFEGEAMRFTGTIGDDGRTIAGTWEMRDGDGWKPWMDVRLTKAA
jgi:Protein of unknown function (DUF1579)